MQAISGLSLFQRDGIGNRNDVIGRADHVSWDAEAEGVRSGTGREGGREGGDTAEAKDHKRRTDRWSRQ